MDNSRQEIIRAFPFVKSIKRLAAGWDSSAYLLDDEWIVRLPKRAEVTSQYEHEQRILSQLNRLQFNLQIPNPVASDTAAAIFRYRQLPGIPFDQVVWSDATAKADALLELAAFLRGLHDIPPNGLSGVRPFQWTGAQSSGLDDWRLSTWQQGLTQFIVQVVEVLNSLDARLAERVRQTVEGFLNSDASRCQPCLIHGDLSPEHVLVDPNTQRISGIIDWGDCGIGDPAYDLWPDLLPLIDGASDDLTTRHLFYRRLIPLHALVYAAQSQDKTMLEQALDETFQSFSD